MSGSLFPTKRSYREVSTCYHAGMMNIIVPGVAEAGSKNDLTHTLASIFHPGVTESDRRG